MQSLIQFLCRCKGIQFSVTLELTFIQIYALESTARSSTLLFLEIPLISLMDAEEDLDQT